MKYLCKECGEITNIRANSKNSASPVCEKCGKRLYKRDIIKSKKQIKNAAWEAFSDYIRVRDCLKTTGKVDRGVCYTCGRELPIKDLQAGHMVSGRKNFSLFDEDNVKAQCFCCNVKEHGMQGEFVINRIDELMEEEGLSVEEALEYVRERFEYKEVEYSIEDLVSIMNEYISKLEDLVN